MALVLVLSRMKTGTILFLACPFVFLLFQRRWSTVLFYLSLVAAVTALFFSAEYLHQNISAISQPIERTLGDEYSIQTFSPRLLGYSEFVDPKNWTMFGTGQEVPGHDMLTSTLTKYGGLPVVVILLCGSLAIWSIHRVALNIPEGPERDLALCLLVYVILGGISGPLTGGFFNTQPLSYIVWTFAGSVFVLARIARKRFAVEAIETKRAKKQPDEVREPARGDADERRKGDFTNPLNA